MKTTVATFLKAKAAGEKLAMLTAYDYTTARLIDESGIDGILVGDSLGTVCLGYRDTLPVTMEDMIHHAAAVRRGVKDALLVVDMPFMSYQATACEAVKNAGRLVKEGGAEAVKVEGGLRVLPQVRAILRAHIPVMGHLGLTPQSDNVFGGYRVQGKGSGAARELIDDAKRLEEAGVFSIVLECVPAELAKEITEAVAVPTIGIGAGAMCDGQILVSNDMFGLFTDIRPRFVKVFADAGALMREGVKGYAGEVKSGAFPDAKHSYTMKRADKERGDG
ncbi:MAG: 3-methyl-2-oxobutanoate hydroxymethyltransferase [Clostridiales bacterium]|nr:3-methyl-2-oxobutanoate hydroxymethyltransferase [Clostridiales bacterium]